MENNNIKFPSILNNFSAEKYYSLPYISQSKIGTYLNECEIVAHANKFEDSDSMRFGRCFHFMFLNTLVNRSIALPLIDINRRTKVGREAYKNLTDRDYWKSESEILEAQHMMKVFNSSIQAKPNQLAFINDFKTRGMVEVTIFWVDQLGNKYKSRLDSVILDFDNRTAHILDLKTTAKVVNKEKAFWDFRNSDWDLQMFSYITALRTCGFRDIKYTILQIKRETGEYGFYNYLAGDSSFNNGAEKFEKGLKNYLIVQEKIKNNIPLSASITNDIDEVLHPAYEA